MKSLRLWIKLVCVIVLLGSLPLPVAASQEVGPATLPPLPEWPVIGPILRWIGVVEEPEPDVNVMEAPLRDLPEYQIETWEDVEALQDIEAEQSVRIRAEAVTLNVLMAEALEDVSEVEAATVAFAADTITLDVTLSRELLDRLDVEIPLVRKNRIQATATVVPEVAACQVTLTVQKLKVNNVGMALLLGSVVNEAIRKNWPAEICLESLSVKPGEIVMEGYRRR